MLREWGKESYDEAVQRTKSTNKRSDNQFIHVVNIHAKKKMAC